MSKKKTCLRTILLLLAVALSCGSFVPRAKARRVRRCPAPAQTARRGRCVVPDAAKPVAVDHHPAIEPGGTAPSIDNTIPLLKPGTFRLDLSGFVQNYDLTSTRGWQGMAASVQESFMLGYGVNDRFTVFGGALEANAIHQDGGIEGNFVDPKVGFVYRVATAPQLKGIALDFVGDAAVNETLRPIPPGSGPYGDLGPLFRARLLATKELGHGFTLQLSGGLFGASVTMPGFASVPSQTSFDVDALLGLAGQYRLSAISNRLYVNGELDMMKPLTRNEGQAIFASPFRTTESYSATIGTSYVIVPGSVVGRLSDTVALNVADDNSILLPKTSKYSLSNTVGVTVSFLNFKPRSWFPALSH